MNNLEIGQVLSLRIKIGYFGTFDDKHPYLIVDIQQDYVEIGQLHSLEGKEYEAISDENKVIYNSFPDEQVIDKDSFIQLNNAILIENYDGLVKYRRQEDKLSGTKLKSVVDAYKDYHIKHHISENHMVYLSKDEIEALND